MKEKDLKNQLQQTFDFTIWKEILPLFFKKVQYFTVPNKLEYGSDKVLDAMQLGVVQLDDDKRLAIVVYEVDDTVFINRNRVELRKIAIKPIDEDKIHGALAFFYNKNQADYRFSFIAKESSLDLETGQLIKGETKPKRFTYLLGSNEACTTAAKRMLVLIEKNEKGKVTIQELKDVFSVEALNKDFFKSYKAHFEKFWKYLANEENPYRQNLIDSDKDTKDKQEKPIRDFCNKLLGRIVFLHFLQKKGWMGCSKDSKEWINGAPRFMQQLFDDFSKPEKFNSQCLTKLFFETLNTKRLNDIFEVEGLTGELNGSRVPYLNGGLFEPEKNKATLEIDFPQIFFKELLEFFDQYNFTIDENSPDDHEVGIDPEMLGHIFENLLEDNRDKGAFYTPKEIVQYMCKESLIQYLLNTFQEQKEIEKFIRFHFVSPFLAKKENAILLNQKLDDIKVCDPAIGSGAFPIGMLQEIFEAKRFIYPYLKTNKDFKPADVKKNIIQHSIYGVDLEKGAVDIAQLRFWLSLVVEELNPHPLPNLDYKIMQGNSLLEQYEGIELGNAALFSEPEVKIYQASMFEEPREEYGFSKENRANIKDLIDDYFKVEEKAEKAYIHKQIDSIVVEHIDKSLEFYENKLMIEIASLEQALSRKKELKQNADKTQKDIQKRLTQLDTKTAARKRLLDFENTDERPYFIWHLYFMDVFDGGGFDVMIGNPPYIQLQKMGKETDILQDAGFETFARTGDIYCLFYEKGFDLLKKSGTLSYITSNSWMKTKYGKALRLFFSEKCNPIKLLNFDDTQIFPSATVEVNIFIGKNEKRTQSVKTVSIGSDFNKSRSLDRYFDDKYFEIDELDENGWVISSEIDMIVKLSMEKIGKPIKDWNVDIYIGILNGFNDAYLINSEIKNSIISKNPQANYIIHPILRGRDLKKYSYKWDDLWLINSHNGISRKGIDRINVEKDYPAIYEHLLPYEELLQIRQNKGDHWTNLRNCAYFQEFAKPKIIWGELSDVPKFAFDNSGMYAEATLFAMTGERLKYLLTVLNSKIALWYFNQITTTSGMGTSRWKKYKIEQLPIPYINDDKVRLFETLAEYLIYLNDPKQAPVLEKVGNEAVSQVFEDLVNMMVYELYFEEEMKAKEIDVLQFITEKAFPDITKADDKKVVIQKVYYELQQKDNPIRNRILVASSRSETIARINAATS